MAGVANGTEHASVHARLAGNSILSFRLGCGSLYEIALGIHLEVFIPFFSLESSKFCYNLHLCYLMFYPFSKCSIFMFETKTDEIDHHSHCPSILLVSLESRRSIENVQRLNQWSSKCFGGRSKRAISKNV